MNVIDRPASLQSVQYISPFVYRCIEMHGNIFDHSGLSLELYGLSALNFCLAVGVFFVTLLDLSHESVK